MPTGLTFDEYFELKLKPHAGADRCFHEAAEQMRDSMFPMPTVSASNHLRSRGYDCRPEMLEVLVKNGVVKLTEQDSWTQADVDAAADYFEDCSFFVPYGMMCVALGCGYADFLRALREAAERESRKYGRRVLDDDQLFVMHRVPPRGDQAAVISFTLADDIRERLERGEEV
jgi:hypothetical protein